MALLQLIAALFSLSRPRIATPPPDQVAEQRTDSQNSRLGADHDDELTSSCSIGCALCSELGYKRPTKRSRSREDVAQWVRAFTAEFAPALPSKPLSHPFAPRRRPQSNHTPFAVAIAEHQKLEDADPASPSNTVASPAWTWYSFPPYPEDDDDDSDSDSAASADGDCVIGDSQTTDCASSAAGVSAVLPSDPSQPLSHAVTPATRPQKIETASAVASADHRKPADDEPASPSTVATSPACSYFSFLPSSKRGDHSDSATSTDGDCVTGDSQSTDSASISASSAADFSSAPVRKKVAAASTHSRQSSESGSSLISWFPLSWLPPKDSPEARTGSDSSFTNLSQNPLSAVYAPAEPSTLVSTVSPRALPSRLTLKVPDSWYFEDERKWLYRYEGRILHGFPYGIMPAHRFHVRDDHMAEWRKAHEW